MKKIVFIGIIIIILVFYLLEAYGPLYVIHTPFSAIEFTKRNVMSLFGNIRSSLIEVDYPLIFYGDVFVRISLSSEKYIEIPEELKSKVKNIHRDILDDNRKNNPEYELYIDIKLEKRGISKWEIVN